MDRTQSAITELLRVLNRLNNQLPLDDVSAAVDLLFEAWINKNAVYTLGNGGSAATAMHLAADLSKIRIDSRPFGLRASTLVANIPLVSALTNDEGFENIFSDQLHNLLAPGDVVVLLSVHGAALSGHAGPWSQNLLKAIEVAKTHGAKTIGICGFDGGMIKRLADIHLLIPVDEEPIATPLIESYQLLLSHLICMLLRIRVEDS